MEIAEHTAEQILPSDVVPGAAAEIADVITLAALAHRGQLDKGGKPYFFHVLRVGSSLLPHIPSAVLGYLHDAREDGPDDLQNCVTAAARKHGVLVELALLTRRKGEPYGLYIWRIAQASPVAARVKLADLDDNLRPERLAAAADRGADVARLIRKYTAARQTLTARAPVY